LALTKVVYMNMDSFLCLQYKFFLIFLNYELDTARLL